MRKAIVIAAAACMILAGGSLGTLNGRPCSALWAEVSREQIEEAIDRGVVYLVSQQGEDGHWVYHPNAATTMSEYDVGHTALAVLALQHSGSKRAEVQLAIKKGMSYILQQQPEPKTYSTGLIMQALYADSATEHGGPVSAYAWMLCAGQKRDGAQLGSWCYDLPRIRQGGDPVGLMNSPPPGRASDNSNSQFGILGLTYAQKAGFQVPRIIWERARQHYIATQGKDGGWPYTWPAEHEELHMAPGGGQSTMTMTLAGTVSSYLCEEMLADKSHKQCETPAVDASHEAGLKWIGDNWANVRGEMWGAYGWYGCERLGMLIGYSDFGGHDWFQEGAPGMMGAMGQDVYPMGAVGNTSFAVLFLARGRNPIIINKLKREGDWNLHRFDISHLIDYISGPGQKPCQWRIVTLNVPVDYLLKVPILWISGHEALQFTPEEKQKLKEYVERGGTILAEDCCSKKPFDESFRAMLKELWPESDLVDLPKTHAIYTSYRKLTSPPRLMGLALEKGQGRFGVLYIPNGISCRWEVGGVGAKPVMDAGMDIYLYVDKVSKQMRAEAAEKAAQTPAQRAAPAGGEKPAGEGVKEPGGFGNAGW